MDLGIVREFSSVNLALSAVCFSCLGGVEIGLGIQRIISDYPPYRWFNCFLFGIAWLGYGVFWALTLLRRVKATQPQS